MNGSVLQALAVVFVMLACLPSSSRGVPPSPQKLRITEWARHPMLQDPVALAFDGQGKLYVVETARRSSVDIDIRAHREWLLDDLASQVTTDTRAFFRTQMATERSAENRAWLTDRNRDGLHDWRDLTTISERIRLLEDTDDDGTADRSVVFAEGFQEEFTGVAAGVLPVDDEVLFTVYPDLWSLRDRDGDGKADEREILFRGFGIHAAFDGHDLHGLTVGPEGKIYFSCGDNGFSISTKEGRRLHHPNTGGVLRMNRDGSDLEVFAIGLRNVQEFDFDQYGNMFAVDNDGDLADERERAVYIAEGSDSGWRVNWQFRSAGWKEFNGGMTYNPWTAEGMWKPQHTDQPAYITPPMQNYSVGPGGFKFNPGTALNASYRNFFFCIQFPVQALTAFRVEPQGGGFQMRDEHLFLGGLMASSVNFGPDGALYIADWVGKWSPNGKGVIYRMDDPEVDGTELRLRVKELLRTGLSGSSPDELTGYLGHDDRRIRQLAQSEFVRRGLASRLLEIAVNRSAAQLGRIHALWGLIQAGHDRNGGSLARQLPWSDPDPQIRQQCARVAGDLRLVGSERFLLRLLDDQVALVRSFAATALGKVGTEAATGALFRFLERNADSDPFLRHATVIGLAGSATTDQLATASAHPSPSVRLGAVLALRRRSAAQVARFLNDDDTRILREAVRAIHDDFSIPAALPAVARLLDRDDLPMDEPIMRRVLSANLRAGTSEAADRLIRFVTRPNLGQDELMTDLKIETLHCLGVWGESPLVDRVEGRIRELSDRDPTLGPGLLAEHFEQIIAGASPGLIAAASEIALRHSVPLPPRLLDDWIRSDEHPMAARTFALKRLAATDSDRVAAAIEFAWAADLPDLRLAAIEAQAERNGPLAVRWMSQGWSSASVALQQRFIATLAKLAIPAADEMLSRLLDEQIDGRGTSELALDLVAALESRGAAQHLARFDRWKGQLNEQQWGVYGQALSGGSPVRGEALYRNHVAAQCVRCHEAGGAGKQAGPELRGIAARTTPEYLLEALVDPSARIAKGFETVTFILDDGRSVSGTILEETEQKVVIGTPQAETVEISQQTIEDRLANKTSAMPDVVKTLTPLEVRDLVAYLSTLR